MMDAAMDSSMDDAVQGVHGVVHERHHGFVHERCHCVVNGEG